VYSELAASGGGGDVWHTEVTEVVALTVDLGGRGGWLATWWVAYLRLGADPESLWFRKLVVQPG
jgi:hypothetical protein